MLSSIMLGAVTTRALACDKARPASGLHIEIAAPAHRIQTKIENKYETRNTFCGTWYLPHI